MERKKRESITEDVRASILQGCRKGEIYDRKKFMQIIEEVSGMRFEIEYRETHFTGALASLTRKGDIICIERGKYKIQDSKEENTSNDSEREEKILDENKEKGDNINEESTKENKNNTRNAEENIPEENCEDREFLNVKRLVKDSVLRECSYLKKVSRMNVSIDELEKKDFNDMMRIKELIDYLEKFQLS